MTEKKKEVKPTKYQTIVLDTATELETVLRQATFEDIQATSTKDRERMSPNEYVKRNLWMSAIFDSAANAGINLISIQYMKTKWEKDSKGNLYDTGQKIIDGWQRTESQADINVMMEDFKLKIVSNRFDPKQNGTVFDKSTFEEVTTTILTSFYGEEEDFPNLIYSVTGDAKSGKTHWAFTASEPIRVYCFNRGADFVSRKFKGKKIDIVNFHLPVLDDADTNPWASPIWTAFYSDFKKTVEESR